MFRKSIVVAFLSMFVAFPALAAQTCTVDFPPDAAGKMYLVWIRHTNHRLCYRTYLNPFGDYYLGVNPVTVNSPATHTTDLKTHTTFYRFWQSDQYWSARIEIESQSVEPGHVYLSEGCENPELPHMEHGLLVPFTGPLRRVVIVKTRLHDGRVTRYEMPYALSSYFELRPYGSSPGDGNDPIAINCPPPDDDDDDDDDDECPNLNLTIRGTLLPARRGTARISGDWCN